MHLITVLFITTIIQVTALAQDSILIQLQQKMDRQEILQKDLVYCFNTVSYIHKLDKNGSIEKTDTIEAWQKFKGDSLCENKLLYSTEKDHREGDGKGKKSEKAELPKFDDPEYDFLVDPSEGRIKFTQKKPKKGALSGEMAFDMHSLLLTGIRATMPKLKWPVNEFSMDMKFTAVQGVVFPSEMVMQAGWNALVSKGRIRVESRFFDYMICR